MTRHNYFGLVAYGICWLNGVAALALDKAGFAYMAQLWLALAIGLWATDPHHAEKPKGAAA